MPYAESYVLLDPPSIDMSPLTANPASYSAPRNHGMIDRNPLRLGLCRSGNHV
jgi:hypothetical protein